MINYTLPTTNRFVVETTRSWKPVYYPRFKDLFTFVDFIDAIAEVNSNLSFPIKQTAVNSYGAMLFAYFAPFRFTYIPSIVPESVNSFISALKMVLYDLLPHIAITDMPIESDDFNTGSYHVESGKTDRTKADINSNLNNRTNSVNESSYNSNISAKSDGGSNTTTVFDETNTNSKNVNDVFLSPQNQGVTPVTVSIKGQGVDGVTYTPGQGNYTTNTANTTAGESTTGFNSSAGTTSGFNNSIGEINNLNNSALNESQLGTGENVELEAQKHDVHIEEMNVDKLKKLQEFYNLNSDSIWNLIIGRLEPFILLVDIASTKTNYSGLEVYE